MRDIEKFLDQDINLSPQAADDLLALDHHSMGTMFEELVRRFDEGNNEEAGEHWTPRDTVRLMANLMFLPVADRIDRDGLRGERTWSRRGATETCPAPHPHRCHCQMTGREANRRDLKVTATWADGHPERRGESRYEWTPSQTTSSTDLRVHRDSLEMTQTLISPKDMAWGPMTHSPDSGA